MTHATSRNSSTTFCAQRAGSPQFAAPEYARAFPFNNGGRKYDHALVECNWKAHPKANKRTLRPDFGALARNTNIAKTFNDQVKNSLESTTVHENSASDRLQRLRMATQHAAKSLPTLKPQPLKKRYVSDNTKALYAERERLFPQLSREERKLCDREIYRSCRNDYRSYINSVIQDIRNADRVGNTREIARLTKQIARSHKRSDNIMPSRCGQGVPFTDSEQLLVAWQEFLGKKFSCADRPGAAYAPERPFAEAEDIVTFEEFDECLRAIHKGKSRAGTILQLKPTYLRNPQSRSCTKSFASCGIKRTFHQILSELFL